ncbi:hypothetical protein [Rubinisphaera italica]|uniref:hypothetical protein n=1 Tax=Rubinisphaera italica TaxID=2527969 RepID=UPI0011B3C774|nr:hypothetical protein [Rubinisphaera italica]
MTKTTVTNPWNEYGVSSYPPRAPMVGQEQVHRHLDSSLKNFQPNDGSSAWFCALTSTWGGGKTRTADELVSQVTGESAGWIDRTGTALPAIVKPDFEDGLVPAMVSYKWVIQKVEEVGRRLPFTEWIPRVTLAALIGLKERATPQLKTVMDHLETFKQPVAKAIRELPELKDIAPSPQPSPQGAREQEVVNGIVDVMKQHGLNRFLVIVEEVEDPSEIRNKPGGVLGQEAYQEIKDTYLDVIPEVLKSDIERQRFPNVGFLLLCSPAVYSTIEKIPSQARRHYSVPIGRNTVADLCGYLDHLRQSKPGIPEYSEALIRAAYLATDRNMGWMNVVMYSVHRPFVDGETDPVSLLRQFAVADPRGKEVFVDQGLARIPGSDTNSTAQKLLYGQTAMSIDGLDEAERSSLKQMKVVDAAATPAFTELYPLRASLSDLLETAQAEPGVQVVSGGGAQVHAGDMKIDLARLLHDLSAYQCDDAGRAVLPRDKDQFVLHLTTLHGMSQTGAAAQYLYPVFLSHLAEAPTHFGPSFAALRQIDRRLRREDMQSHLLDDEEAERQLNENFAGLSSEEKLRRFTRGFLNLLDESQTIKEDTADDDVVVSSVTLERTDPLLLSQNDKIWIVCGHHGASVRDAMLKLCADSQPVQPILLLLSGDDPSQRELIEQFLANRIAIRDRVVTFPLAEVDERLLFLKSESHGDLTNLATSLLYRLTERIKESLADRFQQLVDAGIVVRPLFRLNNWKPYARELAEVWLFLASDASNDLTKARDTFGESFVGNAQVALKSNEPTAKKPTTELVDHDSDPPLPQWPPALARIVSLLKDGARSADFLERRFFGSGDKPRAIVEQMLEWLQKIRLVTRDTQDNMFRVLTRGDIESAVDTAQSWYDNDLKNLLEAVSRYTGIVEELNTDGADMRVGIRNLTQPTELSCFESLGKELSDPADGPVATDEHRKSFAALAGHLSFQLRQMATDQSAKGAVLAQNAGQLEDHLKNKDVPFRDRADGLGAFVKAIEQRVDDLHSEINAAKGQFTTTLDDEGLPAVVFQTPADGLLILTQRDQQLQHTTKGVLANETLIYHLVKRNLKQAEKCVNEATRRLTELKSGCEGWIAEWKQFKASVSELETECQGYEQQCDDLDKQSGDSVYVRNHLRHLKATMEPLLEEASESLEVLQDVVSEDYADKVKQQDAGGRPFDDEGQAVLLKSARKLIREFREGGGNSAARLREQLEPLSEQKSIYAGELMSERGTPTDPGLGLLRYAMNRLDTNATNAHNRLESAGTLRELVEAAYKLREEWRTTGPEKMGDAELFGFFLKVIDETNLGTEGIPPATDWAKLGKLKDQNLITLKLKD